MLYLIVIGAVIASIFWLTQRSGRPSRALPAPVRPPASPPSPQPLSSGSGSDRSVVARLLYGPDCGPGWLRLSPTQLVFSTDSGRVLVIERFDVNGVSVSYDLPDRTVARPALVVSAPPDVHYFEVPEPEEWVRLLSR